ncbi:hypothetical protein SAMN05660874_04925 [Saccharopolyspora flava]|uniref:Uncharacterized protein n=1 Tax=Saccharopolyspora flava TaxID=95161 RepID=A0A1I6UID4_9PSEU|nr:hypothetical protein SAMN05660874_04925 [Saccharopolyspora flava]
MGSLDSLAMCRARECDAVLIEGRNWLVCPIGGPGCFRVVAELAQIAWDALEVHVENHFSACACPCCGR